LSLGLLLVALASLSWAAVDALRKVLAGKITPVALAALLVLGQIPLFGAWAALDEGFYVTAGWLAPGLGDVACNLVASVLFLSALRVAPLSTTIPMLSLTPVFATAVAALALGELPAPRQLAGIAAVVAGAGALHAGGGGRAASRGAAMMTGVALIWAVTMTLDKIALRHASVSAHALLQSSGIAAGLLAAMAARGRLGELAAARQERAAYLGAVVAMSLAVGLQLAAVKLVLVGLLEAIKRAVGLAFAVINGALFFGEPISARKLGAVALMAAGVCLLVIG